MYDINKPLFPDEVVWLEIFKALLVSNSLKDGISYLEMADIGLEEFKQRFRND